MLFEPNQKIVFAGDSITDAGRREVNPPWGLGYVNQVRDLVLARYPQLRLRFVNRGVSGDTTRHLLARWRSDVLAERPDWLVLMIGINDVWRAFDLLDNAVSLPQYRDNLGKLLAAAQTHTAAGLILIAPYMIEPDRTRPMRAAMDRYGAAMKEIAADFGAVVVDTQAAFDRALELTPVEHWSADQIHPNSPGHAIIALAFLRAVGFEL